MADFLTSVSQWIDHNLSIPGLLQPIYAEDASGGFLHIGNVKAGNNLCGGVFTLLPEFVDEYNHGFYPPSSWFTKDIFGVMVPVAKWCLDQNLVPQWLQTAAASGQVTVPNTQGQPITYGVSNGQVRAPSGANANPANVIRDTQQAASDIASGISNTLSSGAVLLGGSALLLILLLRRRN